MFFMMANINKVTMPMLKFCNIKPDVQAYSSAKTLAAALPAVIYSQGSFICHHICSIDKIILLPNLWKYFDWIVLSYINVSFLVKNMLQTPFFLIKSPNLKNNQTSAAADIFN